MNKLIMDYLAFIFAVITVALKHDDPVKETAAIVAATRKVLSDYPPGSTIAMMLEACPDPIEDFLLGLASGLAVYWLNKTPHFEIGGSGSPPT